MQLRHRKETLQSSVKLLTSLDSNVQKALRTGETLSPQEYQALVQLSNSTDLGTQLDTLEAALEHAQKELDLAWAELARTSYHDFYEFMNREEGFLLSPHQKLIADLLTSAANLDVMRFMLSMPPGHCKSTHASHHFPAYWFGLNPKKKFLQAGHSQDFVANELGAKVKSIIDSDDYRMVFSDIRLRSDMRAKDYWGLSNMKGKYVAKGVGQGIAGFRGNFGMVDDPYKSRKDAESVTTREHTFKWYADDFATRLLPGSPLGLVMTRWHSDDVCGRITDREENDRKNDQEREREMSEMEDMIANDEKKSLEQTQELQYRLSKLLQENTESKKKFRFEIINLPAIAEDDNDPLGREVGEPLWEELFDLDALANLRVDMTSSSWNSLYQGTPIDIVGGAVSAEWFQRYEQPPSRGDKEKNIPNEVRRCVISVDTASTVNQRSDYTVIGVWYENFQKQHYLIDVIRKQMEFPELCAEIDRVCKRYSGDALLVETKGNGLSYYQLKKDGGAPCSLIPIEVGTSTKNFRFDEVTPMFEAGQVFLPNRALWLADYEKELVSFPNGKKDDQVDMTSQYLKWAKSRAKRGTKKLGGTGHRRR